MTPELQHALVYLLGALTLAAPATIRAVPRAAAALESALERVFKTRADVAAAALETARSQAAEIKALRRECTETRVELEAARREHGECLRRVDALRGEVEKWMRSAASGGRYPTR